MRFLFYLNNKCHWIEILEFFSWIFFLYFSAAKSGSTAIMQALLTKVRKIERIAEVIHSAIQGGHLEIVTLIMEVI